MLGCDWAGLIVAQYDSRSYSLFIWEEKRVFKKILLFGTVLFSYLAITPSPLEEEVTLHFTIFDNPLPKDTCAKFG